MNRKKTSAILAVNLFMLGTGIAFARHPKVARDLEGMRANATVEVIVQFKTVPRTATHHRMLAKGGIHRTDLGRVKAGVYSITAGELETLANDPDIAYISPNRAVKGMMDHSAVAINALAPANLGMTGLGVAVAVIDSGITPSVDMVQARLVYQESFVPGGVVADPYGHGTHVAGILGGTGKQSAGLYTGIAPGVNIVNLRVLDENGAGTDSNVIAAIQRAIQLKATYNIRVINLSVGRAVFESYTLDPLCQAVEAAWKAGIVVVVASGNEGRNDSANTHGYGTIAAPANDPYAITVGAMKSMGTSVRSDDLIASYSGKGPTSVDHIVKPDLMAPGNRVVSILSPNSTLDAMYPPNEVNGYFTLSGTSMAAPMVSGAAALMLQKQPALTPGQVKARLMKTANKQFPISSVAMDLETGLTYVDYYDVFTIGAGYVDVGAALKNTDLVAGDALSPTAILSVQTPVPLGTAGTFGVLAGSTVTNTGVTVVNGNLGLSPGTAVTGFLPGIVTNGAINAGNAVAAQAKSDLTAAYNAAAGQACPGPMLPGDIGGSTFLPGVYCNASSVGITGTVTLDGNGDSNSVFIFQMGSTLITAAGNSTVNLINGADASNVFWQVGSSATLGTYTNFAGTILAQASITVNTGAVLNGRAFARTAAVTLDTNAVTVPPATPQGVADRVTYLLGTGPGGTRILWGDRTLWGYQMLWGDQILFGDQIIWGDQILWGDTEAVNSLWASRSLWGSVSVPTGESSNIAGRGEN